MLIYNILPGGDTCLHKLSKKGEVLEEIFGVCHPNEADPTEIKYHMPFIKNFEGKSPMDLLHENVDFRSMNMMLCYL